MKHTGIVTIVIAILSASTSLAGVPKTHDPAVPIPESRGRAEKYLPINETPANGSSSDAFVILISGDGGWAKLVKRMTFTFAEQGLPVVGWNSRSYLSIRRTPEEMSTDLQHVISHYCDNWRIDRVILVGYSRGADILPFMASRLPEEYLNRVQLLAFLGLGRYTAFKFSKWDLLRSTSSEKTGPPVAPEVLKLKGKRMLCIYGKDEADTPCPTMEPGLATYLELEGSHHFDGDYEGLASAILKEARKSGTPQ